MCARLNTDEAQGCPDNQSFADWKDVAFAVSELEQRDSIHGLY
jgi:hypothetical protein